ncbi:sugar transferase [Weissella cibaria]|uniref:sugar transferase n=1 Tax=Weissella cibaria TaxID=137591 RepID=UPI001C1F5522|nr:sugar transferase [Weissella cibaria]MBU7545400.1 sugar transferase [Weissella cibaria]MCV3318709.1 sugar transferase [Weissella cibaria]
MEYNFKNLSIRFLDFCLAICGLIFSIIPIVIIAMLIKIDDGGPVFFKQKRVGLNGTIFLMYKIRSMVIEAEELRSGLLVKSDVEGMFKMKHDPRVTNIGVFIRKHSLDELPQFWNVLKGDMSLVGPRPALIEEVETYSEKAKERLKVKPGITGLWQVSGRSDLSFNDMIELDLLYINNRSVLNNIIILFKTIMLIMPSKKNGAY